MQQLRAVLFIPVPRGQQYYDQFLHTISQGTGNPLIVWLCTCQLCRVMRSFWPVPQCLAAALPEPAGPVESGL